MKRPSLLLALASLALCACAQPTLRGTGDLGVVVERAAGTLQLVETSGQTRLARIEGLGDLSHASVVFSRDQRFAYVFGRDGGLSKVDLLEQRLVKRVVQGGNSIGGAISQDGTLIAVGNYEPGGVKVFDAVTLEQVADIPATPLPDGSRNSRVVGVTDVPNNGFIYSLFDTGETWLLDFSESRTPKVTRFANIGKQPYDALLTPDGRYYVAGLFGEDGMAKLDLWHPERGIERILDGYGRGQQKLPVYKMPHLEGWTVAGEHTFVPAIGQHRVLVVDSHSWKQVGAIDVAGQPVFVMARPDGRQIWVNFAHPDNHLIQVIDTETRKVIKTLEPGPAVLHMEFTARGDQLWLSVRDNNEVQVWDPYRLELIQRLPAASPSGIFFTSRAHETGL